MPCRASRPHLPVLALALAMLMATPARPQATDAGVAAPRDAAAAFAAAVAAQDADAIARLYLPEAVLLGPGLAPVAGQDAIRAVWAESFAGGLQGLTFGDVRTDQGADRAAVIWTWTTRIAPPGQGLDGRSLVYFARTPDGWRISADMWQAVP